MTNPMPLDLTKYTESLFLSAAKPKRCPDCQQSDGGYRGTELCVGCYRDRYAEERDYGDEANE